MIGAIAKINSSEFRATYFSFVNGTSNDPLHAINTLHKLRMEPIKSPGESMLLSRQAGDNTKQQNSSGTKQRSSCMIVQ